MLRQGSWGSGCPRGYGKAQARSVHGRGGSCAGEGNDCFVEHRGRWHRRWVNVRTCRFQALNRSPGYTGTTGKRPEPEHQPKAESGRTSSRGQIQHPEAVGQRMPQVGAEGPSAEIPRAPFCRSPATQPGHLRALGRAQGRKLSWQPQAAFLPLSRDGEGWRDDGTEGWGDSELVALTDQKTDATVCSAKTAAGMLDASPSKHVHVQARPLSCHRTRSDSGRRDLSCSEGGVCF